ncbi:MAG: GNAT family N-acetyltransferase, partial [Bacteroidota bacterium]
GICGFYRLEATPDRGELIQMYVRPNLQGQQIGFRLLQATIQEIFQINGLRQIDLQVKQNLQSAIHIYQKIGFQQVEYPEHSDLIHMTLLRPVV